MSAEAAAITFGALLILIAILGGGFQAKEIVIPTIGSRTRGVCATVGAIFVGVGVFLAPGQGKTAGLYQTSNLVGSSPAAVTFRIYDELAEGQVSEQVRIVIDDQVVGTVTVSAIHRNAELLVSVPKAGRYSYQLSATAVFMNPDDKAVEYVGSGAGYINVAPNGRYDLEGDITGETWIIRMVQRQ